ncbi:hypothetical protein SAMN04487890_102435 [Mucilaginibacter polytrichastri]|nr:hypothetical protein SAMN04487890_102435 [Mucilaginibacter polytrichastri]
MSEAGKIDLILKELYESHRGVLCSLKYIISRAQIDIRSLQNMTIKANRLNRAKLIRVVLMEDDLLVMLTPEGKFFCERSSYAYPGFPIITHKQR